MVVTNAFVVIMGKICYQHGPVHRQSNVFGFHQTAQILRLWDAVQLVLVQCNIHMLTFLYSIFLGSALHLCIQAYRFNNQFE